MNFSKATSDYINSSAKHLSVTSIAFREPNSYETWRLGTPAILSALDLSSTLLLLNDPALAIMASDSLHTQQAFFLLRAFILDCSKSYVRSHI